MTSIRSRLLSGSLALLLALGAPSAALAAGDIPSGDPGESAAPLAITVPDYTPGPGLQAGDVTQIQKGGLYTLLILPARNAAQGSVPKALTAELLLAADPLFVGSAVASDNGQVTFTGIRLRTAEAAVYYVTGPGLTTPLAEATGLSVSASGSVVRKLGSQSFPVAGASVSLEDETTRYAYRNSVTSGETGSFYLDRLSPGSYRLHVEKPGYLPSTSSSAFPIDDDETYMLPAYDLAPYIGDVNNDGARDLSDLTALLSRYELPLAGLPAGLTPDLNEDGAVNAADVALYLSAASAAGELTLGTGAPADAANASLSFRDAPLADNSSDHALILSLDNGGYAPLTFTAAGVSLTFRSDYVQPINQNGGAVAPGGAQASCLIPKAGVTVSNARWELNGDLATLTFSLSCAKPAALTDLVELRYRPAQGKTANDFFQGVFSLDHIAAQVGGATVLTTCALTYPNSQALGLTSITVDLSQTTFTIPASGHTVVLALSATGHKGEETFPDLSGVTWTLPEAVDGVSIADRLLTITPDAAAGTFTLTASRDGVTSDPLTITLENAPSVPTGVHILREGLEGDTDRLSAPAGADFAVSYTSQVTDQYGVPMADRAVTWSLSGAPAGIAVSEDGELTAAASLPAGTYSFTLLASLDSLRAALNVSLTLEPVLDRLLLSGPASAQIPSGAGTVTLSYLLSAVDAQGLPIPAPSLDVTFVVLPAEEGGSVSGIHADVDMSGALTVTLDSAAQSGDYTLRASGDGLSADFALTLLPAEEGATSVPVRAALLRDGEVTSSLSLTFYQGHTGVTSLHPVLFNEGGTQTDASGQAWTWTAEGLPTGADAQAPAYTAQDSGRLDLSVSKALPGSYFFTLTAAESASHLSVSIPVEITVLPKTITMELSVPDTLSIPTSGSLNYTIGLTCLDADGNAVSPPGAVSWGVTVPDGDTSPAGVSIQDGVLTVSSSAQPGTLKLQAQCTSFAGLESLTIASVDKTVTLTPADSEKVLALRREGQLLSGGVDAVICKEGAPLTLTYTPVLLDRATGQVTELTEGVSWLGAEGSFSLDAHAEPGSYSAPITALYDGRSVSLTAQVTVYPNITNLYISFDEGDEETKYANRYSFRVPAQTPKTYYGTLMAAYTRASSQTPLYAPLSQLLLTDYDMTIFTPLTGVYLSYDKSTGRVALTIEPLASSNSMKDPSPSDPEIRYLSLELDYYPGEGVLDLPPQVFRLTKEDTSVTSAILRQGKGTGSKFVFETARGETDLSSAPGALSDCFALELLDQYGAAVTTQPVTWTLKGSPTDGSTSLITLLDPGEAVEKSYPRYQSLRRLRVDPQTPAGTYPLTLSASAAGFSRSIQITMEVVPAQPLASILLTGPDMTTIPRWYNGYNSSAVNNEQRELAYVSVLQDALGHELDPSLYTFSWAVTDHAGSGSKVDGVSIRPNSDNTAAATVTVDRYARSTVVTKDNKQVDEPLRVTVTVTPKTEGDPYSDYAPLTLRQGNLVPTLMTVNGPSAIKLDLPKADASNPKPTYPTASKNYTFTLVNQYNDPVSTLDARAVEWTWSTPPSYVTVSKHTDSKGLPYLTLKVNNPKRDVRATVTLTASITFPEASTTSGKATVYRQYPVTITVGNPSGGGGLPIEEEITASTVTPSTNKSGTSGTSTLTAQEVETLSKTTAGTLTIAPKNTSGLTSVTVTFPGSLVKDLRAKAQSNSLRIQTAIGTVTLPKGVLGSFSNTGNVSVTIRNQNGALAVTFTSNGRQVASLSGGSATFSAPVKGNIVTAVSGGVSQDVLKKTVITNGTLTVSLTGSAELTIGTKPQGKTFSDTSSHWAKSAIDFVVERGLFQGTSETTFSPNGEMTRSMVVTVLHRLENTPAASAATLFADVPSDTWFTAAVAWANAHGIVQGTGDGFLPNSPVTREQLATILYRYMKDQGRDVSKRSSLSSFSDETGVSSWAREAMEWAVAAGLINGKTGGVLDPGGNASRAEVAAMLERLVRLISPSV